MILTLTHGQVWPRGSPGSFPELRMRALRFNKSWTIDGKITDGVIPGKRLKRFFPRRGVEQDDEQDDEADDREDDGADDEEGEAEE